MSYQRPNDNELKLGGLICTKKAPAKAQSQPATAAKPPPPAQAVKDSRIEVQRGGRGGGRGRGFNRETVDNESTCGGYNRPSNGDVDRHPYGGPVVVVAEVSVMGIVKTAEGRLIVAVELAVGMNPSARVLVVGIGEPTLMTLFHIRSTEELTNEVKDVDTGKEPGQDDSGDANKDSSANEPEVTALPEEKEMTLEEYEKVLEEKRKTLLALKAEERKVYIDKELEPLQPLSNKKNDAEVFIKLGCDKDKRKEAAEKTKKSVSINEFLKPAKGENFYLGGGRGRGRGRGGDGHVGSNHSMQAPAIEDVGQFPSLGGK